jgi:hypothetical protein
MECPGDKEDCNGGECLSEDRYRRDEWGKTIKKKGGREGKYLEHLDVGYTKVEIGSVAQDEACTEEEANGKNRANKHVL